MPSTDFIKAVCEAFDLSSDWLLDINVTENPIVTIKEKQFLNKIDELDLKSKQLVFDLVDVLN